MKANQLIFQLILNISLQVMVASLLSKLKIVQDVILQERRSWKSQAFLAVIFGGMIILSTYTGIDIGSYSLNTRLIGAMAAGLLGGPIVGLYASLIGAIYVYFFSTPQAFAMASAFSTMIFGLLGGGFYPYFQRGKWKYKDLFLLACFAEVCEMVALLRLTVTVHVKLETILPKSIPMILLNAIGILIFISVFNTVFIQQDEESSRQLQIASGLSKKALPLLREGFQGAGNMEEMADIMLQETDWVGVMITDRTKILTWKKKEIEYEPENEEDILQIGKDAMEHMEMATLYQVPLTSPLYDCMKEFSLVAVPFVIQEQSVGCMIVWMKKQWVFRQSELELLQNFVTIGSFQIAMADFEHQTMMRQKAEFKALQFQVNPHFLFNALNTISCVCREDPERARELLIILANYFRYNLDYEAYLVPMEEELNHVRDYLAIEKARFEDKLEVSYELPEQMNIQIPTLILQPIVENAVRHGKDARGRRIVHIRIWEESEMFVVVISDCGQGFADGVLERLEQGEPIGSSIGLSNVHKRMQSIYGKEHGLKITSTEKGSSVRLEFVKEKTKEKENEDSGH